MPIVLFRDPENLGRNPMLGRMEDDRNSMPTTLSRRSIDKILAICADSHPDRPAIDG